VKNLKEKGLCHTWQTEVSHNILKLGGKNNKSDTTPQKSNLKDRVTDPNRRDVFTVFQSALFPPPPPLREGRNHFNK
jgi:hypothetical protein